MLNSSCEWWTAWNRHNGVHRWLAQWASQSTPSIMNSATPRTASRGSTGSGGTVNHGATRSTTREKPTSITMMRGTTAVAEGEIGQVLQRAPGQQWPSHCRADPLEHEHGSDESEDERTERP